MSLSPDPSTVSTGAIPQMFYVAIQKHHQGQYGEAQELFQTLEASHSEIAEIHYFSGLLSFQTGKYREAVQSIERAVSLKPDVSVFLNGLGNAYQMLPGEVYGRKAVETYEKALFLDPNNHEVYNNLGVLLHKQGQHLDATLKLMKSLELNPSVFSVYLQLALVLKDLKRYPEAVGLCHQAIELSPLEAECFFTLAGVFQKAFEEGYEFVSQENDVALNALEKAIAFYLQGLELEPEVADAYFHLGNCFKYQEQYDKALICYSEALQYEPTLAVAHNNMGYIYRAQGRLDEAIEAYEKALALEPNLSEASINLAMAYLVSGRLLEGWGHYESRQAKKSFSEGIVKPQWRGERFQGKTLLVRAEQGYGDTLQFIRYLSWVKSRGGNVILECHPGLTQLLLGFEGVDMLIEHASDLSPPQVDYDLFIPLMSLPFLHQTTLDSIPGNHPYLHIPHHHQDAWLIKGNGLANLSIEKDPNATQAFNVTLSQEAEGLIKRQKIGIAWAGNLSNKNGRHRACPLENFYPLLELPNAQIYSLQKDPPDFRDPHCTSHQVWAEEDLRDYNIIPLGSHLTNFYETAGAISQLDLVVTVDTSIAHLAGALGKPVWVILPAVPDWRWMMNRSDTPWYPTMRLFRQPNPGNWSAVFQEILEALEESTSF